MANLETKRICFNIYLRISSFHGEMIRLDILGLPVYIN